MHTLKPKINTPPPPPPLTHTTIPQWQSTYTLLPLAFTALVAFASAHCTIITATIEEENPFSKQQCSRQVQRGSFNQYQWYLLKGYDSWYGQDSRGQEQEGIKWCCQELQTIDEQCQCDAVREVFRIAQKQQQQQQQGGSFGSQQIRQMKEKAQNVPNQCNFQTRQLCQIGTISITTTTTITEENPGGSQQCMHIRGRRFNKCGNYIQEQIRGSSGTLLMSIKRQGGQFQDLEQCCNELLKVEEEWHYEAMQEVYRQAQQMRQQGSQQGDRRGGSQSQTQDLEHIVQNIRNQCKLLEAQQCRIPSVMF